MSDIDGQKSAENGRKVLDYATPHNANLARLLSRLALCVDAILVLYAIGVVYYVHPKRPPPLFGWNYSIRYDELVTLIAFAFPVIAALLRTAAADLARRKAKVRVFTILIIELLIACTLRPVRSVAPESALRSICAEKLREIGAAMEVYSSQHGGRLPGEFAGLLKAGNIAPHMFFCPSSRDHAAKGDTPDAVLKDFSRPNRCSYIYYGAGRVLPIPDNYVLAHESIADHHGEGINVLYGDGHVEWWSTEAAQHLLEDLAAGHNPPRSSPTPAPARQ